MPKVARALDQVPATLRSVVADVDFERMMVAWLADPGALTGERGRSDHEDHGALTVTVPVVVADRCRSDCVARDRFPERCPPESPYTVEVDWSELLAVHVVPRSSAPLRVQYRVTRDRVTCEPGSR